ncbi:hypothetical protein GCM10022406_18330 [Hymenobacter algoricola]|uniref:Gliding motility-associated C-terminal domain-containing protein n=2 Tax=Hymenobacter algoricola TaxID=486267 RepID=A0ABP7N0V1_9BACT
MASFCSQAQNLVPNNSFEQFVRCVGALDRIDDAGIGTSGAPGWRSPTYTYVYHSLSCRLRDFFGYDTTWFKPRSGRNYVVIQTYAGDFRTDSTTRQGRSYIQATLTAPLLAGCSYRVTAYARLCWGQELYGQARLPPMATDGLAFLLTPTPIERHDLLGFSNLPQISSPRGVPLTDTLRYVAVTGTFVARGGERYLTIGNFLPDAATTVRRLTGSTRPTLARYALDDVSVVAVPPAGLTLSAGPDLLLCGSGSPVTLTASAGFGSYRWSTGQTTRSIQVTTPGRYLVTADFGCGTTQDTVLVGTFDATRQRLLPAAGPVLCPGEVATLQALPGLLDYRWADGPTGPNRAVSAPGRYRLTARTADGCLVRDSTLVTLLGVPALPRLPADTLTCADEPLTLRLPPAPAGLTYRWSDGSTGPAFTTRTDGPVTLTVRNRCLSATATVQVRRQDCAPLTIPNIVTPNGDQKNDFFRVQAPSPRTLELTVYDRWGRQQYHAADYRNTWPAPNLPDGIYYYYLLDQTYHRRYRGWVQVMR